LDSHLRKAEIAGDKKVNIYMEKLEQAQRKAE
jgi:hypothetical protein